MDRNLATSNHILYGDVTHWLELIVNFIQRWPDEDWVPTFDMVFGHEVFPEMMAEFRGNMTAQPPA